MCEKKKNPIILNHSQAPLPRVRLDSSPPSVPPPPPNSPPFPPTQRSPAPMASPAKRPKHSSPGKHPEMPPPLEEGPAEDPRVLLRRRWEFASVLHFLQVRAASSRVSVSPLPSVGFLLRVGVIGYGFAGVRAGDRGEPGALGRRDRDGAHHQQRRPRSHPHCPSEGFHRPHNFCAEFAWVVGRRVRASTLLI